MAHFLVAFVEGWILTLLLLLLLLLLLPPPPRPPRLSRDGRAEGRSRHRPRHGHRGARGADTRCM